MFSDAGKACIDVSAVVILTDWDGFPTSNSVAQCKANGASTTASSDSGIYMQVDERVRNPHLDSIDGSPRFQEKGIDWMKISSVVKRPKLIFDGRNVVDRNKLTELGFIVESIGKANDY